MAGISSSQGLHQVAQKLTSTSRCPGACRPRAPPDRAGSEKSGAGWPGRSGGGGRSAENSAQAADSASAAISSGAAKRPTATAYSAAAGAATAAAAAAGAGRASLRSTSSTMESGAASPVRRRRFSTRV